jgi:hypothetical protein
MGDNSKLVKENTKVVKENTVTTSRPSAEASGVQKPLPGKASKTLDIESILKNADRTHGIISRKGSSKQAPSLSVAEAQALPKSTLPVPPSAGAVYENNSHFNLPLFPDRPPSSHAGVRQLHQERGPGPITVPEAVSQHFTSGFGPLRESQRTEVRCRQGLRYKVMNIVFPL